MEELNQKLDKDTFNRFKLIQHLIKKYPIIKYDISRIEQIKNSYIEYNPKYSTIDGKIKFTDSEFLSKHVLNQLETFNKYIQIVEENIDIKIAGYSVDNKLINQIYNYIFPYLKKNVNDEQKTEISVFNITTNKIVFETGYDETLDKIKELDYPVVILISDSSHINKKILYELEKCNKHGP